MTTNSFEDERCLSISENLKVIRERINDAAVRSGRSFSDVQLMAVTKTVPIEYINYSIEKCGVDLIGENKVQEYLSKKDLLFDTGIKKHLIGHLQTNKIKKIAGLVDMIQSVDSVHVAKALSDRCTEMKISQDILIEVNIGEEESKTGMDKNMFIENILEISEMDSLNIKGIMTIPPICEDKKELETYFDEMYSFFCDLKSRRINNFSPDILSMGMSGDYEEAIIHGSNLVRIGSAIYGARIYTKEK